MKRIVSVLLLSLFLFNVGGYYFLFWGLRTQATIELSHRLDVGDYRIDETRTVKIPITLPYPLHQTAFERAFGNFEHDGSFFQLAKRKLENDTLHIVYIENQEEKALVQTMAEFSDLTNELPTRSNNALNLLSKILKEYSSTALVNTLAIAGGWCQVIDFPGLNQLIPATTTSIPSPPPKA